MKKFGILTYHKYYNYGTVLQAYALQHYISRNFDCEAELIDYVAKNEYVGNKLVFTRIKRLGAYIKDFSKYYTLYRNQKNRGIKNQAFDRFFENNLAVSAKKADTIEALPEICKQYDAIMIGSDQTWNPFVGNGTDYLIDYIDSGITRKLSYAPSIGISKIPEVFHERYKKALSDFDALSCRERAGAKFLTELLGKEVSFVLDPTLLLTPSDWVAISTPVDVEKPYLLTYFLGDNKEHRAAVEKIAAEKNLEIVTLPVSYLEIKNKNVNKQYVGPGEFISLVKNASFVCTDSFHGTMFSINFGKDFISFPKRNDVDINSDNNRLYDALAVLGLEDRLGLGNKIARESIDYSAVNRKLADLRQVSHEYLAGALTSTLNR